MAKKRCKSSSRAPFTSQKAVLVFLATGSCRLQKTFKKPTQKTGQKPQRESPYCSGQKHKLDQTCSDSDVVVVPGPAINRS
jgi:hypothetical protein